MKVRKKLIEVALPLEAINGVDFGEREVYPARTSKQRSTTGGRGGLWRRRGR